MLARRMMANLRLVVKVKSLKLLQNLRSLVPTNKQMPEMRTRKMTRMKLKFNKKDDINDVNDERL